MRHTPAGGAPPSVSACLHTLLGPSGTTRGHLRRWPQVKVPYRLVLSNITGWLWKRLPSFAFPSLKDLILLERTYKAPHDRSFRIFCLHSIGSECWGNSKKSPQAFSCTHREKHTMPRTRSNFSWWINILNYKRSVRKVEIQKGVTSL